MRAICRGVMTTVGGIVIAMSVASTASASCTDPIPLPKQLGPGSGAFRLPSVGSSRTMFAAVGEASSSAGTHIVGLWQVAFTSEGNNIAPFFIPDGATLDAGYAQWHSDGTEIMNSGRDPVTSSFCLGVWQAMGNRTYKLNHFGLSWDNTGGLCTPPAGASNCFVGPANIREEVTVDPHGDTYSGFVTIDQYDTAGHLLFRLKGLVSAQRITAN